MIHVNDLSFHCSAGMLQTATHCGIEHASFTCEPGTVTLLAGPSGSGKSTLISLLNGLAPHFHEGTLSGSVDIQGFNPSTQPLHESSKHSATVFQNPRTQFFTDAVTTELAFALENSGVPAAEIRKRIGVVASETGIQSLLGRHIPGLSGGQLQRVAYAVALMPATNLVLFDEPTSNLSGDGIAMLQQNVTKLKAAGHTIVIAEHRLYAFRELADQVLYIRRGRITNHYRAEEFFALDEATRQALGLRQLTTPRHTQLPAPATPGLEIENLRYSIKGTFILNVDHALFPAGKVTALVGPNGVGKTTLARILCGLVTPDQGASIRYQGNELSTKQRIAASYLVMQDVGRQLFAETAESEVALGLTSTVDSNALLATFDLAEAADRHPHSLSGGQQQRLAMATAMAHQKQIYIFDEPTSGVGYDHLEAIAQQLKSLATSGAVVIVITHDAELIAACADHIQQLDEKEAIHRD
ncbi:MAG: ABC transporter ATP-binding protein [Corynebacterium sp.]|nr:ABC transporter ATP-binding protein [Corynebacterium sp.]